MLIALMGCRTSTRQSPPVYTFNLEDVIQSNPGKVSWKESDVFSKQVMAVSFPDSDNNIILTLGTDTVPWERARYLVCEIWNNNPYSAVIYIDFYRREEDGLQPGMVEQGNTSPGLSPESPRISPKVGILPRLKTQLVIPLSHLDGQEIFMKRFPRQLKGTVMGHRLERSDIGRVVMRIEPMMPPGYLPDIEIASVFLADTTPVPYSKPDKPYVDEFGQWNQRDWPGKVHSVEELKSNLEGLEKMSSETALPDEWSRYGGWKLKRFPSTGYFRVQHDGKRWWMVDPEGYAFLSAGIDCIRDNVDGMVSGQEDLFAWLPPRDSLYAETYTERGNEVMVNFLMVNLKRVFGRQAREKWDEITVGLLKRWRINTIANWSDLEFARKINYPYVLNMRNYPTTEVLLYRDFPDVFSNEYRQHAVEFAGQLESCKNDPFLIGYFLSNEPHWAFGDNNLAFEMFAVSMPSATKEAFAAWLKEKYRDIRSFNAAWNQQLEGFNGIKALVLKESPSDACWDDCNAFSGIMVDKYVEVVCNEVKKVDPNHLNLGLRYAWISSELCYRAGAYFDVFSINGYSNPGPPETAEIARRSGKPVLIGEYHFGATDRGLPSTGIQGAESQQARGEAYRYYLEQGFARPELIGIHYFQWMDQPVFGRFDGENYNIGFLDICMHPYHELTSQAAASHEVMYRVATGEVKPFDKVIRKSPQIFF
jgi:hypothetical protein